MSATGRKRTPSNGPDGEADEGAGLDGGDQMEAGGEGLLAGLVAEPAARVQGSGGAAEEGEAEKVGFGHAPPAGDRAPLSCQKRTIVQTLTVSSATSAMATVSTQSPWRIRG